MELKDIKIEDYLSKFKVHNPKSLFPPNFEMLRQFRCPICFRKLYWNMKKNRAFCKSKERDGFFITRETLSRNGFI